MTNNKTTNENAKKDCKACLHYESCKGTYASAKGNESLWHDFDAEMYAYCGCEDFQHKDLVKRTKYESKKYRNKYQAAKEEVTRLYDKVSCQKAEIKSLKQIIDEEDKEIIKLQKRIVFWRESLNYQPEKVKSESIKEFAEQLKKEALIDSGFEVLQVGTIDNLVKEMTEEVE